MKQKKHLARIALAIASVAVLASACATRPTYRPREPGERVGYTDERISENRARVTFSGSTSTTRRNVENFLLLRAAEVTLEAGYPAFVFDDRNTETERSYYRTDFGTFGGWPYWRRPFGPYAWYYSSWRFSDPFFDRIETTTRYSAYAEIIMLRKGDADREPRAINAQEVIDRLRPPPPPAPPPPP